MKRHTPARLRDAPDGLPRRSGRERPGAVSTPEASADDPRLVAALRAVAALQRQDLHLREEVARLTQAVAQARRCAHHDELTGLPNRTLLLDRFDQAVARGARGHKQVALLFLDLDGFKRVNDVLGHAAGDDLLRQVAGRLLACIRSSDTACRYGGDEFVVLLPEFDGEEGAAVVGEKIRAQLTQPYLLGATTITITSSVGMAVYPVDGKRCRDLLAVSDLAMYRDKARNPGTPPVNLADPESRDQARGDGGVGYLADDPVLVDDATRRAGAQATAPRKLAAAANATPSSAGRLQQ